MNDHSIMGWCGTAWLRKKKLATARAEAAKRRHRNWQREMYQEKKGGVVRKISPKRDYSAIDWSKRNKEIADLTGFPVASISQARRRLSPETVRSRN